MSGIADVSLLYTNAVSQIYASRADEVEIGRQVGMAGFVPVTWPIRLQSGLFQ